MRFVLRVGVHGGVGIALSPHHIAVHTPTPLSVVHQHDLSLESLRMVENPLDQSPYHIRVGASPILPLSVDLEQDHIVLCDQTIASPKRKILLRPVQLHPIVPHHVNERIHTLVVIGLSARDGAVLYTIDRR